MKPPFPRLRHTGLPILFTVVAACSSAPDTYAPAEAEPESPANFYLGSSDVFAHLVTGSGGSWQFTKISSSNVEPESGYLVRLNDLAPAFDTRVAECTPQAYASAHKCNPTHPFRDKEVGVINRIISGGIAAGTAGKVSDVSTSYRTSFDEARFNQAVDEALINSGLDNSRLELFELLDTYAETADSARMELDALRKDATATYHNTATVPLDIQLTVTGLTDYYSGDLDLRELIELVPVATGDITSSRVEPRDLLPCDARTCVGDARRALASLQADVDAVRTKLASTAGSALDSYELRCDKRQAQGYLFRLECPQEIRRNESGAVPVHLSLHIYARDFDALYPALQFEDEHLRIQTGDNAVWYINKTPAYLSITTQTVYYNSIVETSPAKIRVAPGARVRQPIEELVSPAIDVEASYRQMTPDKSAKATFEFGLAANYRVAGTATDSTLFMRQTFNVGCAIDNRLRPGSCTEVRAEEPARDAGRADDVAETQDDSKVGPDPDSR